MRCALVKLLEAQAAREGAARMAFDARCGEVLRVFALQDGGGCGGAESGCTDEAVGEALSGKREVDGEGD